MWLRTFVWTFVSSSRMHSSASSSWWCSSTTRTGGVASTASTSPSTAPAWTRGQRWGGASNINWLAPYDVVAVVDPSDLRDAGDADPPVPHEPCQHRLQLLPLPLPRGEEEKQHRCSAIKGEQSYLAYILLQPWRKRTWRKRGPGTCCPPRLDSMASSFSWDTSSSGIWPSPWRCAYGITPLWINA